MTDNVSVALDVLRLEQGHWDALTQACDSLAALCHQNPEVQQRVASAPQIVTHLTAALALNDAEKCVGNILAHSVAGLVSAVCCDCASSQTFFTPLLEPLIGCIQSHADDVGLLAASAASINHLSANNAATQTAACRCGVPALLVRAVASANAAIDSPLVISTLFVLGTLASSTDDNRKAVAAAGGLTCVGSVLARAGAVPPAGEACDVWMQTMVAALITLGNIVAAREVDRSTLLRDGTVASIVGVLQATSAARFVSLQNACCRVLRNLCIESAEAREQVGAAPGAIAAILSMATTHAEDSAVLLGVLALLTAVCASPTNQRLVCESGGIGILLSVLRAHPTHAELQRTGCFFLHVISFQNPAHRDFIAEEGAINVLLEASRHHTEDPKVVEAAFLGLSNCVCSEANQNAAAAADAINVSVAALRAHVNAPNVAENVLWAMRNLAVSHSENKAALGKAAVIPLVQHVLSTAGSCDSTDEAAISLLATLAFDDDDNKTAMRAAQGGIGMPSLMTLVTGVITKRKDNLMTVKHAFSLLRHLATDDMDDSRAVALSLTRVGTGAIAALLSALTLHTCGKRATRRRWSGRAHCRVPHTRCALLLSWPRRTKGRQASERP
eukprot:gnl/Spiro4/6846_TR3549_c0_g1_i1.p1 gnl/Spiro4/6846_TR3549_c0_g1~~gnl/Spiro4/6846_TR3549_c0_g1_i1.p1  ORF type:complete len:616 (-),score=131.00 gnl/Spiro4/6846_TR3549_c0_g1_i1:97-1944(-)